MDLKRMFILVVFAFPAICTAQSKPQSGPCTTYFGVLQYDPRVPGSYISRMSESQAGWYAKNGQKDHPGLCLSMEKAQYLIVWTATTQTANGQRTVERTADVNTRTTGTESGTFSAYGSLSTRGSYSGTSSSTSVSTITYKETVPVSVTTDYCFLYILKSTGVSVWADIQNKTNEPPAIFTTEAKGRSQTSGPKDTDPGATAGRIVGGLFGHAFKSDPTQDALETALKFVAGLRQ
jgi:hypothetical protein